MPQANISEIYQSVQYYFADYQADVDAVQNSYDILRETTFTVNKELNGLNATLKDSYTKLLMQNYMNDEIYFDILLVVGKMVTLGERGILDAINGMVSCLKSYIF